MTEDKQTKKPFVINNDISDDELLMKMSLIYCERKMTKHGAVHYIYINSVAIYSIFVIIFIIILVIWITSVTLGLKKISYLH